MKITNLKIGDKILVFDGTYRFLTYFRGFDANGDVKIGEYSGAASIPRNDVLSVFVTREFEEEIEQ